MPRLTISLNDDLHCILTEVMERERYRSPSEVLASFLRHWAISQQEHTITGPYASLSPAARDDLDRGLCEMVRSGKGKKGSWLKARIYEAIKDAHGADAKSPTIDQVMRILPKVVLAKATSPKPAEDAEESSG